MKELSQQRLDRPPGCQCPDPVVDGRGNVVLLRTCPVCSGVALDALRGVCYTRQRIGDREVLLVQRDFFSP